VPKRPAIRPVARPSLARDSPVTRP
jgi:hypothetical protein